MKNPSEQIISLRRNQQISAVNARAWIVDAAMNLQRAALRLKDAERTPRTAIIRAEMAQQDYRLPELP